jgi:hypothetical protein
MLYSLLFTYSTSQRNNPLEKKIMIASQGEKSQGEPACYRDNNIRSKMLRRNFLFAYAAASTHKEKV